MKTLAPFGGSLLSAVILFISPGLAWAHGIWMAERYGEQTIVYGHGSADDAYDPAKITSLTAWQKDGATLEIKREDRGTHVSMDKGAEAAIASFTMDNGYWSKLAGGTYVNKPKTQVPDAQSAGQYLKYGISQFAPLDEVPSPVGHRLEILPLTDPMTLDAGDKLLVKVLLAGEPAPNVRVIPDYLTDGHNRTINTDARGVAEIEIRNNGLNVVTAVLQEELADQTLADTVEHLATYSFNLFVE